jgi:hypothetical protein
MRPPGEHPEGRLDFGADRLLSGESEDAYTLKRGAALPASLPGAEHKLSVTDPGGAFHDVPQAHLADNERRAQN